MNIFLRDLKLKNIGIIDQIEVELCEGLNIITGETGAGKSLVINSFNMLLGEKVNAGLIVKTGQQEASIEAILYIEKKHLVYVLLERAGITIAEGEICIRRLIARSGRNKCWINGHIVSLSFLKELGRLIADICGSHSHQELLHSENHILFLDRFCKNQALLKKWDEVLSRYKGFHPSR